jgi:hypothetical protein
MNKNSCLVSEAGMASGGGSLLDLLPVPAMERLLGHLACRDILSLSATCSALHALVTSLSIDFIGLSWGGVRMERGWLEPLERALAKNRPVLGLKIYLGWWDLEDRPPRWYTWWDLLAQRQKFNVGRLQLCRRDQSVIVDHLEYHRMLEKVLGGYGLLKRLSSCTLELDPVCEKCQTFVRMIGDKYCWDDGLALTVTIVYSRPAQEGRFADSASVITVGAFVHFLKMLFEFGGRPAVLHQLRITDIPDNICKELLSDWLVPGRVYFSRIRRFQLLPSVGPRSISFILGDLARAGEPPKKIKKV